MPYFFFLETTLKQSMPRMRDASKENMGCETILFSSEDGVKENSCRVETLERTYKLGALDAKNIDVKNK